MVNIALRTVIFDHSFHHGIDVEKPHVKGQALAESFADHDVEEMDDGRYKRAATVRPVEIPERAVMGRFRDRP